MSPPDRQAVIGKRPKFLSLESLYGDDSGIVRASSYATDGRTYQLIEAKVVTNRPESVIETFRETKRVLDLLPPSRYRSLAITHLEQALFVAVAAAMGKTDLFSEDV